MEPLLRVRGLTVGVEGRNGDIVREVSFDLHGGETVALVGASGSGKSTALLGAAGLLEPPARVYGEIRFRGRDLRDMREHDRLTLWGAAITLVPQEPTTALDERHTIGTQIGDVIQAHGVVSGRAARARAAEMLALVGFGAPEARLDLFPHALSVGMRQRVLLAMALVNEPALILLDEPTSHVDARTRARLIELLRGMQEDRALAIVIATHDLASALELEAHVLVLGDGHVVETGPARAVLANSEHAETRRLIADRTRDARVTPRELDRGSEEPES